MYDLTGQRFGKLVVLSRCGSDKRKNATWNCECDCGNQVVVKGLYMRYGDTRSCGCLRAEVMQEQVATHNESKTRLYKIWAGMKTRCTNPNADNYMYYGGRGIKVCDEWTNSFESFRDWALENGFDESKLQSQCSLDRIDDDGDYSPENCRWVDAITQCNNQRSNKKYTYDGQTHTIAQWARIKGMKYTTLKQRIYRGMAFEQAINR